MTLTWLALGGVVLCWPVDASASRLRRLADENRLSDERGSGNGRRLEERGLDGRRGVAGAGADPAPAGGGPSSARWPALRAARLAGWLSAGASAVIGSVVAGLAAALGLSVLGSLTGAAGGLATAVVAGVGLVLLRRSGARRGLLQREADVSQALAALTAELQAGADSPAALAATFLGAEPAAAEFEAVAPLASGDQAPLPGARSDPVADTDALDRVVSAWRMSSSTGVPLAEVLSRVRADLSAAAAMRREVSVAVAGPRSSAVLLALLPLVGVALGSAMGADPLRILFTTEVGRALLCAGVIFDGLGLLWTDTLIGRAQR